jgi:outer membrane protein
VGLIRIGESEALSKGCGFFSDFWETRYAFVGVMRLFGRRRGYVEGVNMRSVKVVLAVVLGLAYSAGVSAEESESVGAESIAIVDVQKVVNETIIGKAAKSNLEREMQKAKVKLSNMQADFEKQKAELQKQSAILSGTALEERREALAKKQREVQTVYQEAQQQLASLNDKEIKKVVDQISEVVNEIADDRDFEFVFEKDRQAVIYASPRIDITQDVIKILDKKKVDL